MSAREAAPRLLPGERPLVAPSLLACDFAQVGAEVERAAAWGSDALHLDFMDGRFVPNLSFGFPILDALVRSGTPLPLDVHLMVEAPETYLERLAEAGVSLVTVHWEACLHLHRTLAQIKELGMQAGVAFNPHTPVEGVAHVWELLDSVLIMTVNPGFGGQRFLPAMLAKVRWLADRARETEKPLLISVDGGVDERSGPACVEAGANLLVAGSYLFGSEDAPARVRTLSSAGSSETV